MRAHSLHVWTGPSGTPTRVGFTEASINPLEYDLQPDHQVPPKPSPSFAMELGFILTSTSPRFSATQAQPISIRNS